MVEVGIARAPRVLVLDEEPAARESVERALRTQGYRVRAAATVDEALAHLAGEDFDAVVADYRLARASPLLGEVRRYPPMTLALILAGPPGDVSTADVVREGAHDHLTKPYDSVVVKAIVGRAIERVTLTRAMRELTEELDEANAQLRANAHDLQRRIDEATAALRQKVEDLDEAKRRLEEAHHQREEFISMIAHELGNPLTAVSGYVQLIGRPGIPAESQERARATVLAETRRMSRLVEDLCDASRLAAGHFRIRPAPCDLAAIVREQVDLARSSAGQRTIELDHPGEPVPAVCDRDRVAQVLANLLSNAIKYAPGGTIMVRLFSDDQQAHITVGDEGPGIPPELLSKIFEPHVRLATTGRRRWPKGAGLGLAIAKGIVEAHGGHIRVESAPGAGATFTIAMPLAPAAGERPISAAPAGVVASSGSSSGRRPVGTGAATPQPIGAAPER